MGSSGSSGFGCEQVALHIMDPWNGKPWKLYEIVMTSFWRFPWEKRGGCDDNFHEHHYVFKKYRKSSVFCKQKCGVGESHAIYPVDDRSIELTRSYRNQVQAVVGRNQRLLRSWQRHRNIHVT